VIKKQNSAVFLRKTASPQDSSQKMIDVQNLRGCEIGRGREATVYMVAHSSTAKHVAVRVPREQKRMTRYTLLLCSMPLHAHLVHIQEADAATGRMVLEYVCGGTLADELVCCLVSPVRAMAVTSHVLRAVAHLHAHGFVHGDVSPNNVLVDYARGECKLTDYFAERPRCGAPAYMAPEAARGAAVEASDVWSVGCLMLAVTGRPPWQDAEIVLEDGTCVELRSPCALLYHLACRTIALRGPPEFSACADPCGRLFFDVLTSVFEPPERRVCARKLLAQNKWC
jgi:serine/threonine protein kinase